MTLCFISDIHLREERPDITAAFHYALENDLNGVTELYLLGDIFEYWIGDDAMTPLHREVADRLLSVSKRGIKVFFMHGNRDFLVGYNFCKAAGATLLPDPSLIRINNKPVLLMHGDSLNTDDKGYQRFRRLMRANWVFHCFPTWPLWLRMFIARKLRGHSNEVNQLKPMMVMDVNAEAVIEEMNRNQVELLIHGHTHRPDEHEVSLQGGKTGTRIVLGDWHTHYWMLKMSDDGSWQQEQKAIPNCLADNG